MPYSELKKALKVMFEYFEKSEKKELFTIYLDMLRKYDEESTVKQIYKAMKVSKFMPKVSEITEIFREDINTQMEKDWPVFLKEMNGDSHNRPMSNWVFTLREQLGRMRCRYLRDSELNWFKKEYKEAYPLIKKGKIPMKSDPNKYLAFGSVVILATQKRMLRGSFRDLYIDGNYKILEPANNWDDKKLLGDEK